MLFKKLRIIFLSLLFFSLFVSCENAISYDDEEENQSSLTTEEIKTTPSVKYGSINGYYQNYSGALPATIQKSIAKADGDKLNSQNRSAIPALGSELNQIEYYVIARAEGEEPVSGSVSEEDKTFSISGLKFGIDWDIEVGINVKQIDENGNISWLRCFYDTTENVKLSQTELSISRNLILKPDTSGYGSVDLDLTADTNITGLEIKLDDTEQKAKWQAALAADEEKEISTSKIKLANLPSGQYDLTLLFKRSDESYPCYSTTQTIIVINGMTTDTWQNTGTSLISTTGEFNLTSTIISNYVDSCIYVGSNSASDSIGVTPDNSNEGRAYSPLASVNEAIKRIRSANVSRNYKIFISGEHAENIKIGGEGADVLPGTAASSITIQGLNNNAADVLKSPDLSTAPCLSIQTDIPVIFKNLKITTSSNTVLVEYNSSTQGGGLYIKTGSVTLDSGALIDGCIISGTGAKGAGIYLDSGKLTIKTGAKISNNHFPNSNGFGGGIYIKSGAELILSGSFDIPYGGSVTQNDIYVEAADSIKIKNAISPQAGTSGAMATITPSQDLQRGVSIVSLASGSSLSSIAPYKDYFALSNNDWIIKANSAGNALIIDAPIYVAGVEGTRQFCTAAGAATGNGTKSAPFATIEQAVNAIIALNTKEDYTIYVDGEIIGLQSIPSSLTSSHASGITIKGASGNTSDILNGNGASGTVLTISSPVPVTIKDLIITGANNSGLGGGINMMSGSNVTLESGALIGGTSGSTAADESACANLAARGAGIYSAGNLTLKNGSSVTYNYAGEMGGGIYCDGGSLSIYDCAVISLNGAGTSGGVYTTNDVTISGPVIIAGNVNYTGNPSNLYLEGQKKVILMGSLTNGEENAQIGISKNAQLNPGDSIVFTSNYGTFNSGVPGTYFTGDRWTVAAGSGTSAGEAVLTTNGGNITIDPIYEDIKISIDKSLVYLAEESKTFTFTASAKDSNGNNVTVSPGTGTGKVAYSYTVTYHGELLTSGTHFTLGDDVNLNTLTLSNSLPEGNYTINVVAIYNGNTYCAEFNVTLKEYLDVQGSDGTEISDFMRTSTAKYLKVKFTNDYGIKAPDIPESEKRSSGYYDSDMKLDYSCIIPAGKTLELTSDVPVTIKCNAVYYMFSVSGTLIIGENVKLTGTHLVPSERSIIHGHLINIYSGGKVILDGGTITNGVGAGSISSHAIEINNRGTLIINSGYITNGNGGGGAVQVNSGGKVEMYGGEISDNIARGGKTGGVTVQNKGTFIKSGGVIKNNTLSGNPSQLYVFAGGKYGTSENNLVTYSEDYEVTDEL